MDFDTYTADGLTRKLHAELKKDEVDTELVTRINKELRNRSPLNQPQMSVDEQIYWILKDINFEKIQKAMEAVGWSWGGSRVPTITELIHSAENRLRSVAEAEQSEYPHFFSSTGGFHAERSIYDGVMCLSLKFVISGWDMDYDCVTGDNYSDTPYKPNWTVDDVATITMEDEEREI